MIVRILLIVFVSGASTICYLAGYTRIMSGLLIGFGALASFFFGMLFIIPEESRELWFPVYGEGQSWPFFLLSLVLVALVVLLFRKKEEHAALEQVSSLHFQYFLGAVFAYLLSVFLPALLWFPSDEKRLALDAAALGTQVFVGTCLYLLGTMMALYLFYKASKGSAENYPDLMRKIVLAFFALLQLDKVPAFVAFLLIYSPETQIIYPSIAALALAGYLPVSYFLMKLSWQSAREE